MISHLSIDFDSSTIYGEFVLDLLTTDNDFIETSTLESK